MTVRANEDLDFLNRTVSAIHEEGQGLIRVQALTTAEVLQHPQREMFVETVHQSIACMCCNKHRWRQVSAKPPALYVLIQAEVPEPNAALVTLICRKCMMRPGVGERVTRVFRRWFPGARKLGMPMPAPSQIQ